MDWEEEFDSEGSRSDNKGLLRFIGRILRNWYWFVLCGALGLGVAYVYLRYTLPVYKIHAKLLVLDDQKGGGSPLADLSGLMNMKSSVDNEVEVLLTADLMRQMVLAEQAFVSYYKKGRVHDVPVAEAPYELHVLTSSDSIEKSIYFDIKPLPNALLLLSNADTSIRVREGEPFIIDRIGLLRLNRTYSEKSIGNGYGFQIAPLQQATNALRSGFSANVTNKSVSTIDLTSENTSPERDTPL